MRIGNIFNQINNKYKSHNFTNLNFDSRKCKKGDIFFSIKGTKKNGSQFFFRENDHTGGVGWSRKDINLKI